MRRTHFIRRAVAAILVLIVFMTVLRVTRAPIENMPFSKPIPVDDQPQQAAGSLKEQIAHKDLMDDINTLQVDEKKAAEQQTEEQRVVIQTIENPKAETQPQQLKPQEKQAQQAQKPQEKPQQEKPQQEKQEKQEKSPEEVNEELQEKQALELGKRMFDDIMEVSTTPPVVIFSKSYCPHSKRAKSMLLEQHVITPQPLVVELDVIDNGSSLQKYLKKRTGRGTVPNVFVNGQSMGGASELAALGDSLTDTLKDWSHDKYSVKKAA